VTQLLFAIVGPTGTGKTELSLDLAEALKKQGGAEIVNADAMQLYRGMNIGTAKLPPEQRRGIAHHLFDELDVTEESTAAAYQPLARSTIEGIHAAHSHAILVGGSGLYVSSVLFDFAFPGTDVELRAALESEAEQNGIDVLYERLRRRDPAAAARIDAQNPRRVIRALEVLELTGTAAAGQLPEHPEHWRPSTLIGLWDERERLTKRLDARVEAMWSDGLIAEVIGLRERGLERGVTACRAIGYAQALAQVRGEISQAEAIAQTQALTRRFARRQMSWFKRYSEIRWFKAGQADLASRVLDSADPGDPVAA